MKIFRIVAFMLISLRNMFLSVAERAFNGSRKFDEQIEYMLSNKSTQLVRQKPIAYSLLSNPLVMNALTDPGLNADLIERTKGGDEPGFQHDDGDVLPIRIIRQSNNIPYNLQAIIGAPTDFSNNYKTAFDQTGKMPANVTCVVSVFNDIFVRFTFTDNTTLKTDNIDVWADFITEYPTLLEMWKTDWISAKWAYLTAPLTNYTNVFAQSIRWGRIGMFGSARQSSTPISSQTLINNFVLNLRWIRKRFHINSRKFYAISMPPFNGVGPFVPYEVQLDLFVQESGSGVDSEANANY